MVGGAGQPPEETADVLRRHGGRRLTVMPVTVRPLGDPVAGHDRPDDAARTRFCLGVEPVRDGGRLRELVTSPSAGLNRTGSFRVDAPQQAGALAHLDEVAVGVAQAAAQLGTTIHGFGEEVRALSDRVRVEGGQVGDPHVEEAGPALTASGRLRRDPRLVGGGAVPAAFLVVSSTRRPSMSPSCYGSAPDICVKVNLLVRQAGDDATAVDQARGSASGPQPSRRAIRQMSSRPPSTVIT